MTGIEGLLIMGCVSCHGSSDIKQPYDGVPVLNNQNKTYLINQLKAFRSGDRKSEHMEPVAKFLTDEQINWLADYFNNQPGFRPIFNGGK